MTDYSIRMSSSCININTITLDHEPLDADHLPLDASGNVPTTGYQRFDGTDKLNVGIWEHSIGVSTDTEVDEVFVIISGKGRVVLKDGSVLHLLPGVML